ncbi:MAG TPA: hypothetical protein V6D14_02820 [Coleofasciculaceae cyanobacterium]
MAELHSLIRWSIPFMLAILKDSYMGMRSPSPYATQIERSPGINGSDRTVNARYPTSLKKSGI